MGRSTVDATIIEDVLAGLPYARAVLEEAASESDGLILTAPVYAVVMSVVLRTRPRPDAAVVRGFTEDATVVPFDRAAALIFA